MSLPDWAVKPIEIRRAQATLRDDERVVHVWRPKRAMHPVDTVFNMGGGVLASLPMPILKLVVVDKHSVPRLRKRANNEFHLSSQCAQSKAQKSRRR